MKNGDINIYETVGIVCGAILIMALLTWGSIEIHRQLSDKYTVEDTEIDAGCSCEEKDKDYDILLEFCGRFINKYMEKEEEEFRKMNVEECVDILCVEEDTDE